MVRRPAVSRVEALVGVLVAALLTGLGVGGVAKVRAAADRAACANNLRNLGLGVHNCCDTEGTLPPLADQPASTVRRPLQTIA